MLYDLAYNLRMPVYKLEREMPYEEYLNWHLYFNETPIGWRDDRRFMVILQALGIKEKAGTIFPSLAIIEKSQDARTEDSRLASSLKRSGFLQHMLAASDVPDAIKEFSL